MVANYSNRAQLVRESVNPDFFEDEPMSIQPCNEPSCEDFKGAVELVIGSKAKSLGDFDVRRVLPASKRRSLGPFVFFDHMGPAEFSPGQGIAVRPHPHIGLATVTYLFEGTIQHRDSLGFNQPIEPGAVNWMTAGRGIVHSERTPDALRASGSLLHGFQVWVALPKDSEETEPSFVHHPAQVIPRIDRRDARLSVICGEAYGGTSPVETASNTLYVVAELDREARLEFHTIAEERAIYVADGEIEIGGRSIFPGEMAVLCPDIDTEIHATESALIALIGGDAIDGPRHQWWNFVSSSKERIEIAKADWKEGRFDDVPGESECIPLPD